jgi:hypothetical protein
MPSKVLQQRTPVPYNNNISISQTLSDVNIQTNDWGRPQLTQSYHYTEVPDPCDSVSQVDYT